ncbi:ArsR/SmtB family transcription factor [Cellulomonas sp. Marseille-Q8402]
MDALGDPVRRRLVELLADGTRPAGELAAAVGAEFGISQPAASRHLRVLREAGLVTAEVDGARRLYAVRAEALDEVQAWLLGVRRFWDQRLDALGTEVARGARQRGHAGPATAGARAERAEDARDG